MDNRVTCTINLYKGTQRIGNILIRLESTTNILDYINQCVQNYNRNLTNPDIGDELLTHRFFDIENLECNLSRLHQRIPVNSYNHVKENLKYVRWPSYNEQDGEYEIGLTLADMEINKKRAGSFVNIYFDKSIILMNGLYDCLTPDEYCSKYKLQEDDLKRIPFLEVTFSPGRFYFNQLEDILDIVSASKRGFKYIESDTIFVPRE